MQVKLNDGTVTTLEQVARSHLADPLINETADALLARLVDTLAGVGVLTEDAAHQLFYYAFDSFGS
jgi:hypothetical protein